MPVSNLFHSSKKMRPGLRTRPISSISKKVSRKSYPAVDKCVLLVRLFTQSQNSEPT